MSLPHQNEVIMMLKQENMILEQLTLVSNNIRERISLDKYPLFYWLLKMLLPENLTHAL